MIKINFNRSEYPYQFPTIAYLLKAFCQMSYFIDQYNLQPEDNNPLSLR